MPFTLTTTGQLNQRIELQELKETPDRSGTGEILRTYTTYATVWAAFRTLSGGERLAAQQVGATLSHEITIRYRSDVLPVHRIKYGSRIFDIKDVRNLDEKKIEIRMQCVEVIA